MKKHRLIVYVVALSAVVVSFAVAAETDQAVAQIISGITEGGRTKDIRRVREAYRLVGAADRIEVFYYPKYATPDKRPFDDEQLPEGLSDEEYFRYANVDVPERSFKGNVAVPWLAKVLGV